MKIAITGGGGFVGRHLAQHLAASGHDVVILSRRLDGVAASLRALPGATLQEAGLDDVARLTSAITGCDGIAHCAGVNREWGKETYHRVHVLGTRNVVAAAQAAGVARIVLLSFLRARPACRSPYHESKFEAEEIVRRSGLSYTVLKPGVLYGRGDHMLDHLSAALKMAPIFPLIGFHDPPLRPVAVADLVRILHACLVDGRHANQTIAVVGPETLSSSRAFARVARVLGRRPLLIPLPVTLHMLLAWLCERLMRTPPTSLAQVRMLSEGIADPLPPCPLPDPDLLPTTPFSEAAIRAGLPTGAA